MHLVYSVSELYAILKFAGKMWNYDILLLDKVTDNKPLQNLAIYLFVDVLFAKELFEIEQHVIENYFSQIESQYLQNPYHNSAHGADVAHSVLFLIFNSECKE